MKIMLLRHGPPEFKAHMLLPVNGAKTALDLYAVARVTTESPLELSRICSLADVCVTSQLMRAIDSAQALGFDDFIESEIFNESELPHPNRLFIPLPWGVFVVIYRLLWFFGFKLNCSGIRRDRQRARKGSQYLSKLAEDHGLVLLVGHGIMNRLLCSELQKAGWQIDRNSASGYWSSVTMSYQAPGKKRNISSL